MNNSRENGKFIRPDLFYGKLHIYNLDWCRYPAIQMILVQTVDIWGGKIKNRDQNYSICSPDLPREWIHCRQKQTSAFFYDPRYHCPPQAAAHLKTHLFREQHYISITGTDFSRILRLLVYDTQKEHWCPMSDGLYRMSEKMSKCVSVSHGDCLQRDY